MTNVPSKTQVRLAQIVIVLLIGFLVVGALWYGISSEELSRFWTDLRQRPGGPMTFRFILQPLMATTAAVTDGIRDAKTGRSAYLWTVLTDPQERGGRLREGVIATSRTILLGIVMDTIYQVVVLKTFYPAEAAVVAILLAFVPYLLIRGPADRVANWWIGRSRH